MEEKRHRCGYQKWAFHKIKIDREKKKKLEPTKRKTTNIIEDKHKGLVVIPYVKRLSGAFHRTFM